jgi:hypothetical protein
VLSDDKYYGVYRAIVADAEDPEELGRVKLIIPQILGQSVTGWAWPVGGEITQSKWPYGTFYTNSDQNIGTSATTVINWQESASNKLVLENNKFYAEEEGDYLINVAAVIKKDTLGFSNVNMWLKKNNVNVSNSSTAVTSLGIHSEHVIPNAYVHIAPSGGGAVTLDHTDLVINHSGSSPNQSINSSFILRLLKDDYIEICVSSDITGSYLNFTASGSGRPATPGMTATISLIGKHKPQPNAGVWAMFEGGDPSFPLWLGGF